jgi:YHS domain-containing protein
MKNLIHILVITFAIATVAIASRADEPKPKPYPLDTCLVCGMKFGAMSEPYVFVYQRQEIKVCNQSEQAGFKKNPQKYLKKLAAAEGKLKQ